jgi:hypothetical protein
MDDTVNFKCPACGLESKQKITPMPKEDAGGREGFFIYDFDCPGCKKNWEGVLGPMPKKEDQQS